MAVAVTAHRARRIIVLRERRPFHAGELRALAGPDQNLVLRLSTLCRHEQCLQQHVSGPPALQRAADDFGAKTG